MVLIHYTGHLYVLIMICTCSFHQAQILKEGILEIEDESTRYFLLEDEVGSFELGKEACFENGGVISVIDNKDKFDFVEDLVNNTDESFYIGLKRRSLTETFDFVDGLDDNKKSFFLTPFQLPWVNSQPNNNLIKGEDNCVRWEVEGWFDIECSDLNSVICRRECGESDVGLIVSECFNEEFEIVLIEDEFTFDEAIAQCDLVEAKVARVKNLNEFIQIESFLEEPLNNFESFYVGLQRSFAFDPLNPHTFSFTNDEDLKEDKSFFDVTRGTFPWGVAVINGFSFRQPNNDGGIEECVEWRLPDNLWFDEPCSETKRVLCQKTLNNDVDDNVFSFSNLIEGKIIFLIILFSIFVLTLIALISLINKTKKLNKLERLQ